MSTYEFVAAELGIPAQPLAENKRSVTAGPDSSNEQLAEESEFLRIFGNNVPVLKKFASDHQRFKIEMAKKKAGLNEITMHEAHKKIEASYDIIEEIYKVDEATVSALDLQWLRRMAVGQLREAKDLKLGTPYSPPSPERYTMLERISQYTEPVSKSG